MKVLTFSKKVTITVKHGAHAAEISCNPGSRFIFDNDNSLSIQQNPGSAAYILEVSDLEPYLKEIPRPLHWKKKRVLFYRNRGYGDQLIASSLSRFFREVLGAEAFQLSDRVHEPIWNFNPFIGGSALSMPLHIDSVWRATGRPFYDGSFFLESVSEWDNDSEQPNVYDRLFAMAGIDPARVLAKFKRPIFTLHPEDIEKRSAWLKQIGATINKDLREGYIFTQLRTTNKVRSLPAKTSEIVLAALNEVAGKKNLVALVADDEPLTEEIAKIVLKLPNVINVAKSIQTIRLFGSIIGGALAAVGPDSVALHFAAAFEVPAVGIWGPFSPESRCKHYPNQTHLFHRELCANAPCYNYLPELPYGKCPQGTLQRACEVFEGITYQEVYDALLNSLP